MIHDTIRVKVTGGIVTMTLDCEIEIATFEPDPELINKPIRVGIAAEKYNVGQRTISGWARRGLVKVIEQSNRVLILEESSVARAAGIFLEASKHYNKFKAGWVLKRSVMV